MADIVVLGAGGHAKVMIEACRSIGRPVRGLLAPEDAESVLGVPVLGNDTRLADPDFLTDIEILIGIGTPEPHRRLTETAERAGARFASVSHASATVSPSAAIAEGVFVNAGAVVNAEARIGAHCLINTGALIDHDCRLERGVNIAPGAVLAGGVQVGEHAFIGLGARIAPGVTIGAGAVVMAGAVVLSDVEARARVAGLPAAAKD